MVFIAEARAVFRKGNHKGYKQKSRVIVKDVFPKEKRWLSLHDGCILRNAEKQIWEDGGSVCETGTSEAWLSRFDAV